MRSHALLITPVVPRPDGNGLAMRAWNWVLDLARTHRVLLVIASVERDPRPAPEYLPVTGMLQIDNGLNWTGGLGFALGLFVPWLAPLSHAVVQDWLRPGTTESLKEDHEKVVFSVDRIVVFRLYLHDVAACFQRQFPQARLEMDMDDVESSTRFSIALALLRRRRFLKALFYFSSGLQYRLLENKLSIHYAVIWLAAMEDTLRIKPTPHTHVRCFPNRLSGPQAVVTPLAHQGVLRLFFVGNLKYPPNEIAVQFLIHEVVPRLRQVLNRPWKLVIAGSQTPKSLQIALRSIEEIDFYSSPPDLSCLYGTADMVLVPLHCGGGTKLKTLEAFSHGRPVIATSEGVRGLEVIAGIHYWPAEDGYSFANAIVSLAEFPSVSMRIADKGRAYFLEKHYLEPINFRRKGFEDRAGPAFIE